MPPMPTSLKPPHLWEVQAARPFKWATLTQYLGVVIGADEDAAKHNQNCSRPSFAKIYQTLNAYTLHQFVETRLDDTRDFRAVRISKSQDEIPATRGDFV